MPASRFTAAVLSALAALSALLTAACAAQAQEADYEAQFRRRAEFYIRNKAQEDPQEIMAWARRIDLGDPHKYALPPILARLSINPADPNALGAYRELMKVDAAKGDRGLYHFAAYLRARLYWQLKDRLPRDIVESNEYDARNFFEVLKRGGTENHTWMHRATGLLWAAGLSGPLGRLDRDEQRAGLSDWLTQATRRLYTIGQGEYDSSTYVCFSAGSLMNLYDFCPDPAIRDVARAGLDWLAAATALKYFHGCNLGPESRGFAERAVGTVRGVPGGAGTAGLGRKAVGSNTDWLGWLWWGDSAAQVMRPEPSQVCRHEVIVAAMSSYRPHPVIRNIANKRLPLPLEVRGSKPAYSGPKDNKDQEYLYFDRHLAMGTLYSGDDGVLTVGTILPQTTMFKALLLDEGEVRAFGASSGYHLHFPLEGRSPFDQYHQKGAAAINICHVAGVEQIRQRLAQTGNQKAPNIAERSILGVPAGLAPPLRKDGWFLWQAGKAYLAARPLNGQAAPAELPEAAKVETHRWLVSPGPLGGWAIQLGQQPEFRTLADFASAVAARCRLDMSAFQTERVVTFTSLAGDVLKMRHTGPPGGKPQAWTNGQELAFEGWPVYETSCVSQELRSGVMILRDGLRQLTIDFSGDRPVFTERTIELR